MTQAKRSNLKFIMKEAHKLTRQTIKVGYDYMATFSLCLSIISKRFNTQKPTASTTKQYMGGICTPKQYAALKAIKAAKGQEMKKTRDQISSVQASLWIAQYGN